jgi:hypothetical protein
MLVKVVFLFYLRRNRFKSNLEQLPLLPKGMLVKVVFLFYLRRNRFKSDLEQLPLLPKGDARGDFKESKESLRTERGLEEQKELLKLKRGKQKLCYTTKHHSQTGHAS